MVSELDPVALQVLVGALRSACEEMGAVLVRSAHSANIKERRDCSTALFDPAGELVMQAEHIPVHLGSMPDAVAAVLDVEQRPGDLWILNDPYRGGTHLPDITLISPVFAGARRAARVRRQPGPSRRRRRPDRRAACRRDSTRLEDEGVVIPPTRADDDGLRELAERMRNPRAAARRPARPARRQPRRRAPRWASWPSAIGEAPSSRRRWREILDYAERRTRARARRAPRRRPTRPSDVLEGGQPTAEDITLRVAAAIEGDELLRLDFAGTDAQVEGNLNCPLAVTKSAAFFAVRVLTDPDGPPSAGRPPARRGRGPGGLPAQRPAAGRGRRRERRDLQPGRRPRAGRAGAAPPAPAQGQGTMNNLTLAGEGFTYYETIGGGQGACPDADGPERGARGDVEHAQHPGRGARGRVPAAGARAVGLRRGSGGAGRHRGGDGIVREIEALEPMRFTLITERRRHRPAGREGGGDGARRAQPAQRRGASRQGRRRAEPGRPAADRDAGRRRLRSRRSAV